ncbi:MAG: hypothetical protein U9N87_14520, partial [Planctomycetota bacterium]|nr:hypothetical protein [Planctomycetota bacterium]
MGKLSAGLSTAPGAAAKVRGPSDTACSLSVDEPSCNVGPATSARTNACGGRVTGLVEAATDVAGGRFT